MKINESDLEISKFEVSDYLHDKEVVREFLTAALEEDNPDFFIVSLAAVAKARGMSQLAKEAGLSEECLRNALAEGSMPSFETIQKITKALGVQLAVAETVS